MSRQIGREPCPSCRSMGRDRKGDNAVLYDNNTKHCFSCGWDSQGARQDIQEEDQLINVNDVLALPMKALTARGISHEIAAHYGVRVEANTETGHDHCYYFPLYKGGNLVGYQAKPACKPGERSSVSNPFRLGDTKDTLPFGSHIIGHGRKFIIVTEGAEDCLAASQMLREQGKNYNVVATLGTDGWKRMIEYFHQWGTVVIAYDQDGAGRKAALEFAQALRPGQGRVMTWSNKYTDPNACLISGKSVQWVSALLNAEAFRPDGIISGEQAWNIIQDYVAPESVPYPPEWIALNHKTQGMRRGEISMWTAGSGIGKSAFIRRIKQHLIQNTGWKVGDVELEESKEKTIRAMLQWQGGKLLRDMTREEKREAYEATYGTERMFTLDHRSQYGRKGDGLMGKMNYLHHAEGVDIMFIDHVTIAVNELGDGYEGNAAQDKMMDSFLQFVENTQTHVCLISHLRKSPGGAHSWAQGAIPTEEDMKGSGSIYQVSADCIAVSRNKQHDDPYLRNVSQLSVLKCREIGDTGLADRLFFDRENYCLTPAREIDDINEGEQF